MSWVSHIYLTPAVKAFFADVAFVERTDDIGREAYTIGMLHGMSAMCDFAMSKRVA